MNPDRKLAAVMAAVTMYIQNEEEALLQAPPQKPARHAVAVSPLWGMSGRQHQMQLRGLMQLRTFK